MLRRDSTHWFGLSAVLLTETHLSWYPEFPIVCKILSRCAWGSSSNGYCRSFTNCLLVQCSFTVHSGACALGKGTEKLDSQFKVSACTGTSSAMKCHKVPLNVIQHISECNFYYMWLLFFSACHMLGKTDSIYCVVQCHIHQTLNKRQS